VVTELLEGDDFKAGKVRRVWSVKEARKERKGKG
jgi:hypothetical protein